MTKPRNRYKLYAIPLLHITCDLLIYPQCRYEMLQNRRNLRMGIVILRCV